MKSYQKEQKPVKGRLKILDEQVPLETAVAELLNLSVELGMEVVRQLLEADVTAFEIFPLLRVGGSKYIWNVQTFRSRLL